MTQVAFKQALPGSLSVDAEKGIISGVPVITSGMVAHGHNAPPFEVDAVLLQQVADAINAKATGVQSRFTHAEVEGVDSINVLMGKIINARVVGNRVLADFQLGRYADGTQAERLFAIAEDAPECAGLSIVPEDYEFEQVQDELRLRVSSMFAVDWVGTPAANPSGMLSKKHELLAFAKDVAMPTEAQLELLRSLNPELGDSPEDIAAAVEGLDEAQRAEYDALGEEVPEAALMEEDGEELPVGEAPAEAEEEHAEEPAMAEPVAAGRDDEKVALAAQTQERDRVVAINELVALSGVDSKLGVDAIADGTSAADFRALALSKAQKGREAVVMDVSVGEDRNLTSLRAAMPDAIMLRADSNRFKGDRTPHERANEFRGLRITQMARAYFQAHGVKNAMTLPDSEIVNMISPSYARRKYPSLAQSTDAFDNILADTINKSLTAAYLDAPASWELWARRTTNPDFKTITRAALSESPDLVSTNEGGELNYVALGDKKETYSLTEYKAGIKLTRQAIVNDDLDAFSRIPQLQGSAARRKEDDVAYAIITANATMNETSRALFNTTDGNLASSGAAPSVATLQSGFSAMFNFQGPKSAAYLELQPKFLLVPSALKATADQLINSTVDPAKSNAAINPFANALTVVPSARLNSNSATAWYLLADHRDGQIDTVEVCFLEGEEQPVLTQEEDFDTDDMKFKVRHTVAAKAIDWRGMYKDPGA